MPVESLDRIRQDDLKAPSTFGINISPSLEKALLYGMAVYKDDRCPDMGTLISLFERAMRGEDLTIIADNAVTDPRPQEKPIDPNATMRAEENLPPRQPQGYRQPAYAQPQQPPQAYTPLPPMPPAPPKKSSNAAVIAVVCVILVLLIAGGAVTAAVLINRDSDDSHQSSSQSSSATEKKDATEAQATEAAVKMPNVVGMTKEAAIEKLAEYNLTVEDDGFIETESNAQSPGKVFSQTPKKDTEVTEKTHIKLYIAKALPTEKPTEKPKATEKPSGSSNGGASTGTTYYSTAETYVSLRESTSTNAAEIRKIWRGQSMKYISTSGGWYYVQAGGAYGYVSSKYVSTSYSDVPSGTATIYVNSNVDDLKLRSSASENASILETIPPGAAISFMGGVQDNGYTRSDGYHVQWAYVSYNGSSGYIYDFYVHD